MCYAYILRSISDPSQRYIGSTQDLRARLAKHNKGDVPHTAKYRPWKVETYIALETIEKAAAFERYLKSGVAALSPPATSDFASLLTTPCSYCAIKSNRFGIILS